jgi:hypothetical protein
MGVVRAEIQTVEDIYRLVWTSVANRQPIQANYQGRYRLFCPHRLGRNREGNFVHSVTNMAARVGAGSIRWVRRQTGVVLRWRN